MLKWVILPFFPYNGRSNVLYLYFGNRMYLIGLRPRVPRGRRRKGPRSKGGSTKRLFHRNETARQSYRHPKFVFIGLSAYASIFFGLR